MTELALRQESDDGERRRLGDRLREARKYLGLKQEEVATYLKIPRTALTDIENLEHQDVIVLLAPEARRAFPRRHRKAVLLEWPIEDPSRATGTEAEVRAAYEKTYKYIQNQLLDLVSAIRDSGRR